MPHEFVFLTLLARPAAGAEGLSPDVLLYDGESAGSLVSANLDGDARQELVWYAADRVWIAADSDPDLLTGDPGTAAGKFGVPVSAPDYDGDGVDNLLVVHFTHPDVQYYDYTLSKALNLDSWSDFAAGDVDGDGYEDLVDGQGVLLGSPTGFTRSAALDRVSTDTRAHFDAFPMGDLDGDGGADVAVSIQTTEGSSGSSSAAELRLYLTADLQAEVWPARWSWAKPPLNDEPPGSYGYRGYITAADVTLADVDGDGVRELVVVSAAGSSMNDIDVSILGDLTSPSGPRVLASQLNPVYGSLQTLGDLDGDGDDELLFTNAGMGQNLRIVDAEPVDDQVLTDIAPPLALPVPDSGNPNVEFYADEVSSSVGDFDGDGTIDIAVAYNWAWPPAGRVAIWCGSSLRGAPPCQLDGPDPNGGAPSADGTGSPPPACGCASSRGSSASLAFASVVLLALARRRRSLQVGLGVLLAGCQERVALPEVPIVGGTAEQRAQVRDELLAFDEWTGGGRVRLTEVRFESSEERWSGLFEEVTERILLDEELDPSWVRGVLRHELCHALDFGEDLLKDPEPLFDEAGDLLYGSGEWRDDTAGPRKRRGEALAEACEIGPFGAYARSVGCDGEPEIAAEVARWAAEHVWQGFEPLPQVPLDPLPIVTAVDVDREWDWFGLSPSPIPDRLQLRLGLDGAWPTTTYVSLYTGEPRDEPQEGASGPEPPAWARPPNPPGVDTPYILFRTGTGVSSGVGATYAWFSIPYLGITIDRVLRTHGAEWALADPPCKAREEIFAADDRLWYGWDHEGLVHWQEIR